MSPKPSPSRSLSLLRTISSTALKAGKEALTRKLLDGDQTPAISGAALRFVQGLDDLKGAAMKVGQLMSLAHEATLPKGWKLALEKLQSTATPRPWEAIEPLLKEAWGSLEAFASINPVAVHAASIGQVHRGTLKTGEEVAIKVRYPGLEASIHSDLAQLKSLLKVANALPIAQGNFDAVFHQVEKQFLLELDFLREKTFYETYKKALAHCPQFYIPSVFPNLCTSGVLVTMWVPAQPFDTWLEKAPPHDHFQQVCEALLSLIFYEIFHLQCVQTDPNPGNFLVDGQGRLVLLDFGAVQTLSPDFVAGYAALLQGALEWKEDTLLQVSFQMGFIEDSDTTEALNSYLKLMELSWEPFRNPTFSWKENPLSSQVNAQGLHFARLVHFRPPPPELVFFNRRLIGTQLLLERLKPTLQARSLLEDVLKTYQKRV